MEGYSLMLHKEWKWIVLALAVALLTACAGGAPAAAPDTAASDTTTDAAAPPSAGGDAIVRIGWAGSPDTLNPGAAILSEAYTIFGLVYDAMYQLQLDGSYTLNLAEAVDVSEDGTVWTFTIRDGFTWSDGEPLTAADVAFSYNFYKEQTDFPFLNVYTAYFDTIEATDDKTVVITLTDAIPNMESQLVFLYVLPEHIWSAHTENAVEFENVPLVGSGAFTLVEYSQNQFVRLEANKDHPLFPPTVDGAVFQTFDNQDALVQALRTGQLDMITEMPNTAVPSLRNEADIQVVTGPPASPSVSDIIFNLTTPETCPPDDGVCSGHPALLDVTVRRALAHATDKQQIIDVTLLGLGTPGLTLIPDSLGIWYNAGIEDYAFDIDEANRLLDEAGYVDSDGDGVRDMPDGSQPLRFRVNWPSDSTWASRGAEILAGTWSQIGVATELQALDPDALTSVCCPTFDYDVILWGWGSDPDPAFLLSVMITDEIPTGTSETGYSNPEYDDLYRQQAVTLDLDARRDIVWRMQEIVHDDVVYIIPFYAQNVQAFRTDRFQGWITDAGKVELSDLTSLAVVEPVE
ncbi:MAG: ABC transporter substrate-binding protein [Caldilineaceae bacterium]|nr:ABC transporter substrate-binding protein [Caldilineaceae bacterium]